MLEFRLQGSRNSQDEVRNRPFPAVGCGDRVVSRHVQEQPSPINLVVVQPLLFESN